MTLKHSFVSPVTDGGDASLVGPDEWNHDHAVDGTDLALQFNNGGSLTAAEGTAWDNTNKRLTIVSGTQTSSHAIFNLSQTWNNATANFNGIIYAITDTASLSGSRIIVLKVNGGETFTWTKEGQFTIAGQSGDASRSSIALGTDSNVRFIFGLGLDDVPYFGLGDGVSFPDTQIRRGGVATFQFGGSDVASTTPQILAAQSVAAGTSNTAGSDLTIRGSLGTGTGAGGSIILKTAPAGTSGTSQNSAVQQASLDSNGLLTLTDFFQWGGGKRSSANFSKTNDTTLANVTDLSVNVRAGRTYSFRAVLFVSSGGSTGGLKAAIGGTATATNIIYSGHCKDTGGTGTHGYAQASSLGGAVASSTTTSDATTIFIDGTITVNAAGTLTVQAAQNTSNGTATVFARGSYFLVYDVP